MTPQSHRVLSFIYKIINDKSGFFFWLFVRLLSAFFPLITVYQFSLIIRQLENHSPQNTIFFTLILLFIVRVIDNFLRLISTTRLDNAISNIGFDIHNYFLTDIDSQTEEDRHAAVQAVRNFSEASSLTLSLFKQPGIDSLVSLLVIPFIIFTQDFPSFVLSVAYILIYFFLDIYTTQRYAQLKDNLNTKTEQYYAKLQDSNDYDVEQRSWGRHFDRLCHWSFTEWSILQNIAVVFYCLMLGYLCYLVVGHQMDISKIILIMGYVTQIQPNLNAFSQIKDSLTDMLVGIQHLAKNNSVSAIDLDDLI